MTDRKRTQPTAPEHSGKDQPKPDESVVQAHHQAERDIAADPEASASSPNDDLDEGELARLGESPNGI